ncbi:MAG: hypothetical protein ACRC2B_21635, partial [Rubrivivax sp.]
MKLQGGHALAVRRFDRVGLLRVHALSAQVTPRAAGQALGYPQMRVGREGADSPLDNALSDHRAFGLTRSEVAQASGEVVRVVCRVKLTPKLRPHPAGLSPAPW